MPTAAYLRRLARMSDSLFVRTLRGMPPAVILEVIQQASPALLRRLKEACQTRDHNCGPDDLTPCSCRPLAPIVPLPGEVEGALLARLGEVDRNAQKHGLWPDVYAEPPPPEEPSVKYRPQELQVVYEQRSSRKMGLWHHGDLIQLINAKKINSALQHIVINLQRQRDSNRADEIGYLQRG